jgi:hypothetical protein
MWHLHEQSAMRSPCSHVLGPLVHGDGSTGFAYDMRSSKPTLLVPIAIRPWPASPHAYRQVKAFDRTESHNKQHVPCRCARERTVALSKPEITVPHELAKIQYCVPLSQP